MSPWYIVLSVGCLECEQWTYIHSVHPYIEQACRSLAALTGVDYDSLKKYTATGDLDFDKKSTCEYYTRYADGQRIGEVHKLNYDKV